MPWLNPQIFREYDIRGLVDRDLTPETVRQIGQGFGTYLRERGLRVVTLGRDNRLSSCTYAQVVTEGLQSTGCDVIDLGEVPTPLLYFSLFHLPVDGGMMITGSHNPPEFNGFKLCAGREALAAEQIQAVHRLAAGGTFAVGKGARYEADVVTPYRELLLKSFNLCRPLRVVLDAGSGMAGPLALELVKGLGCQVQGLYTVPDGRYPHHHPDPTIPANLADLIAAVKGWGGDVGLAYDGDADRLGVVDDRGQIIWGDQLLILFGRDLLSRRPGAKIIFEVKCSQNLVHDILRHGGQPIMWATGHSLIKKKMAEEGALLAGEMSGHLFFAEDYFGYDDAFYASCRLLQILASQQRRLSALLADLPPTFSTPEIRVDCPDEEKFQVVEEIKAHFQPTHEVITIDGVRVIFEGGWGLVRASNTQPALVLRFEADSAARLQEIQATVLDRLRLFPVLRPALPVSPGTL